MVPPASDRVSRVPPYSGYCSLTKKISRTGLSPSMARFPNTVPLSFVNDLMQSATPKRKRFGLACGHFARRYFGHRVFFLFLPLLRCFSSRRIPSYGYFIHRMMIEGYSIGFPHSDIRGSVAVCASPRLFAAFYVLHRLPVPRHSPFALCSLTCFAFKKELKRLME